MSPLHETSGDQQAKNLLKDLNKIRTPNKDISLDEYNETNLEETNQKKTEEKPFKTEIVWKNVIFFIFGHSLLIYGVPQYFFFSTWPHFLYGTAMTLILAEGIVMGAHRYYAHRSFKASRALQIYLILTQTACSQNCLWVWVRDHRQHHKYTDTNADPHNANRGFFFSHVGWLLCRKHPDVIEKGKGIDMSDLDADPIVMFQKRHYKKLWLVCAIILPALFPIFVLGEHWFYVFVMDDLVRIVVSLNMTWMVNSWAHLYGTKPFDKGIMPGESYLVSFLTTGEGWHNYHHTFPWDYSGSELGSPFNLTSKLIRLFSRWGWTWDLRQPTPEMVRLRAQRTGDGSPIRSIS